MNAALRLSSQEERQLATQPLNVKAVLKAMVDGRLPLVACPIESYFKGKKASGAFTETVVSIHRSPRGYFERYEADAPYLPGHPCYEVRYKVGGVDIEKMDIPPADQSCLSAVMGALARGCDPQEALVQEVARQASDTLAPASAPASAPSLHFRPPRM